MKPSYLLKRETINRAIADNFNANTWYDRLNLLGKLKRFCQICTGTFLFWLMVAVFTLLEPLLCSNRPVGKVWIAQVIVLATSSLLYIIQLIGVASREWDKIIMIQALSASSNTMIMPVSNFTPFKLFIFFTAEGEYILEFCCLVGGWCTIFLYPGLAVLRCFRVFRLLWFYEVEIFKKNTEIYLSPLVGIQFVKRGFKVLKFAIKSLTALGNEMFRLTNATRGGLLLMCIFFYSAFVLGTTLWIETGGEDPACNSFSMCSYTMMRLTFYDGTGFDFTYSLTEKHKFLFFICIVYMCLTSFGILNGLVGIFGTAFTVASDDAFNDDDEDDEEEEDADQGEDENNPEDENAHLKEIYTSFRDMHSGDNNSKPPRRGSGDHGSTGDELFNQVDVDDDDSEASELGDKIQPIMMQSRQQSMSKGEIKALQSRLKGALGAKSNFAMQELTKMAQDPPKPAAPRRTLRDIIKERNIGKATGVHPVYSSPVSSSLDVLPRPGLNGISSPDRPKDGKHGVFGGKKPNKNLHAAVGMFASLKNQKSNKNLNSSSGNHNHGASGGANSGPFRDYIATRQNNINNVGGGIASHADIKAITASVHTLQRTVEIQSIAISALTKHIEALTVQLHALHSGLTVPAVVEKDGPIEAAQAPPRKFSNFFFHTNQHASAETKPNEKSSTGSNGSSSVNVLDIPAPLFAPAEAGPVSVPSPEVFPALAAPSTLVHEERAAVAKPAAPIAAPPYTVPAGLRTTSSDDSQAALGATEPRGSPSEIALTPTGSVGQATLTSLSTAPQRRVELPSLSLKHTAAAAAAAAAEVNTEVLSERPEGTTPTVSKSNLPAGPSSDLGSLSNSKDATSSGPGIELPRQSSASPQSVLSPNHKIIPAVEQNISNTIKLSPSAMQGPTLSHIQDNRERETSPLGQHGGGGSHNQHKFIRHKPSHVPSPSPSPNNPNSILGAMGKINRHKSSPLDEFSSSVDVLDLPESLPGEPWEPNNRPTTSPFEAHRHPLVRPSTTPNASTLGAPTGNQQDEQASNRAGAGRRADTGNGWLNESSNKRKTPGPDDVTEMLTGDNL